jgi:dynein heavy chain
MTQGYRTNLLKEWITYCEGTVGLNVEKDFDLSKHVVKQHIIRNWINQKLPDDQYSIENAIFLKYSLKWPLIIDPQNQVIPWIKEMEGPTLKIVKSEDALIFRTLEQAIRLGQPVLIENVGDSLDPLLDPILLKQIVNRGAQKILKLGDVEVEYNESFRLYLVTSLPNPHYLPSTFIKVNVINFTITFKCLFEQFLSLVVLKERPELEKERTSLLESISKDFTTLRELEDKSLNILSSNENTGASETIEGNNLLDDQNLIDVLKQTKKTSVDIGIRLKKNEDTEKNLNFARQKYSAIAIRASILYFNVQNLASLNVMYQFSLSWFYTVFQSCLGANKPKKEERGSRPRPSIVIADQQGLGFADTDAETHAAGAVRPGLLSKHSTSLSIKSTSSSEAIFSSESEFQNYIESIILRLTLTVYQVVSWGLFAEHQLIFSFSVCVNILRHPDYPPNERISQREYNFFLNSTLMADMHQDSLSQKIKTLGDFKIFSELALDEKILRQLLLLEEMNSEKFNNLCLNMLDNHETLWREFMSVKDPYKFMSANSNCFIFFSIFLKELSIDNLEL